MFARFRNTNPIGRRGERIAARWLRKHRYRVIGRNVHVGVGEADIVCLAPDRRTLVAQAVAKSSGMEDRPLRIDVIGVDLPARGRAVVRHHESAVGG